MGKWAKSGDEEIIAALQSEVVLLRDENAELRLERQQHVTPATAGALVGRLADAISNTVNPGEVEWATLGEALMLRECLLTVCNELERATSAVRVQLENATPMPELDRRQPNRRASDQDAAEAMPARFELVTEGPGAQAVG